MPGNSEIKSGKEINSEPTRGKYITIRKAPRAECARKDMFWICAIATIEE